MGERKGTAMKPVALRIMHPELYNRINTLSKEQNLSINMTINMLLGFAFNEIDRQGKKFKQTVVFESE